jgi:GNAT superfamily N-acetyltransferase
MPTFTEIERIQDYLRASAHAHYEALPLPPFTLFFHPADPLKYFNYAIPDGSVAEDLSAVLADMRRVCRRRGRVARFEFFEAYAPRLPALLRAHGFVEEDRQWSMLCTPQTIMPVPEVPDLEITSLLPDSAASEVHDFLTVQRAGFTTTEPAEFTDEEIQRSLADLQRGLWYPFLGRIAGQPVGVASFGAPIDGVTEVTGIATLPALRRRGIAARLTWQAVRVAFDLGVETVCLTAADARAGRVYERVGFQPFSTMLAYIDNSESF